MTRAEVLLRVKAVEDAQRDPEVAHGLEDDLYRSVLGAIAQGAPNAEELANAALHTQLLDFPRWTA